jgi:hypothetical protein
MSLHRSSRGGGRESKFIYCRGHERPLHSISSAQCVHISNDQSTYGCQDIAALMRADNYHGTMPNFRANNLPAQFAALYQHAVSHSALAQCNGPGLCSCSSFCLGVVVIKVPARRT